MTPRVQLHPLPSQALLFFPKDLVRSCCQPAGTFHAQRMFICSGILRMHHEGGLKNQLAVTWVAGVMMAEEWSVQWLPSWKQHLETDPSTAETRNTPREARSVPPGANTHLGAAGMACTPPRSWLSRIAPQGHGLQWMAGRQNPERKARQANLTRQSLRKIKVFWGFFERRLCKYVELVLPVELSLTVQLA